MRLAVGTAIALAALYMACGGVNMSDDQRVPTRAAAGDGDEDLADDDDDAGNGNGGGGSEDASPPPQTVVPADAGPEAAAPIPEGSFGAGTALVTTGNLNLRDGPGTSFAVLLTMPTAAQVKVQTTSGADGWVHVDYQGTVGYASKMFLQAP